MPKYRDENEILNYIKSIQLAKYKALYYENEHKKKCMVTIRAKQINVVQIFIIRQFFLKKLSEYKSRKKDGDKTIKYFSVVELGDGWIDERFDEHLHFQLFYTHEAAIEKALQATIDAFGLLNTDITYADSQDKEFFYIMKDYLEFDVEKAKVMKARFPNQNLITSSHKEIPNGIVVKLYTILPKLMKKIWDKTDNRYIIIKSLVINKLVTFKKHLGTITMSTGIYIGTYLLRINKKKIKEKYTQEVSTYRYRKAA